MKLIKVNNVDEIVVLNDLHIGSKNSNMEIFKRVYKYILDNDCKVLLLGDLLDVAIFDSVSKNYDYDGLDKEMDKLISLLKPIKHKIIGATSGNHELRMLKKTGFDVTKNMLKRLELNVDKIYHKNQICLLVKNGKISHTIFATHGSGLGGGKLLGSKLNGVDKLRDVVSNANCYIMGHCHTLTSGWRQFYTVERHHERIRTFDALLITLPAYLLYNDSYGQDYNMNPQAIVPISLDLSHKKISFNLI